MPRARSRRPTSGRRTSISPVTTLSSDRKSTRLNSSHTEIYTLSLHDALPIYAAGGGLRLALDAPSQVSATHFRATDLDQSRHDVELRSEEHTSELQSHRDLHSFPTRRSSDLCCRWRPEAGARCPEPGLGDPLPGDGPRSVPSRR